MQGETVTVWARTQTGTDRYGKPVYGWPVGTEVAGAAIAPRSSEEPTEVGRQAVITGLTVYLPTGTTVTAYDRLTIRGAVYEVTGEPGDWRNPYSGRRPGVELAVTRVAG